MADFLFASEAELCAAFIAAVSSEKGWVAYPETQGWDIVLLRKEDGFQIGVEAKLKLNAKVICQASEDISSYAAARPGPDCRAVLVPSTANFDLRPLLPRLGLTLITMRHPRAGAGMYQNQMFDPGLPVARTPWNIHGNVWFERAPESRLKLPDYVPDVAAGMPSPVMLTSWKVAAIKIAILVEKRGYVTRSDFSAIGISMSRWTQSGWIKPIGDRRWGPDAMPDFRRQHPVNYEQIAADFETWKPKET